MDYDFTAPPDARAEIQNLLDYNGFSYREREDGFHVTFEDRGCRWNAVLFGEKGCAVILSRYPFPVDGARAQALAAGINERLLFGSMVAAGDALLCRTTADLFDGYMAYEAIGRALEYNAGAMVHFWAEAAAAAAGTSDFSPQGIS